ncbi:MAG: hypothetical protein ACRDP7_23245 [Trebonia sp.]
MNEVFLRYLDPAFRYVRSQVPALVRSREDAIRAGLNCVALAHLVTRDLFGYTLPAWYQSLELVRDLAHFEPVHHPDRMQAGDLVWLGADRPLVSLEEFVPRYRGVELLNFSDFPVNHVAICTGTRADGDHVLLHASTVDGTNALWPLRRFDDYDRYRRIYAIRRLRLEFRYPGDGSPGSR